MEKLKHFSHEEHPLILSQADEADQNSNSSCCGCLKPILTEPSYKCRECNIFLHKRCAELPRELINHPLHDEHPLKLLARSPDKKIPKCKECEQVCNGFIYHCSHCYDFDLDIPCLFPEGQLEHPSDEHPLTLLQKKASFKCDACGIKKEEQSYICGACQLWIHKSCALLPRISHRKDHEHPLSLAYSYPIEYRKYKIPCDICSEEIPFKRWVYYCERCRYFVDLCCMKGDNRRDDLQCERHLSWIVAELHTEGEKQDLIQLPTNNFVQEIRHILEKKHGLEILRIPKKITLNCCPHNIDLVDIQNLMNNSKKAEITCNRCMEPIDTLCYQCSECNYFFHLTCAQLPAEFKHEDCLYRPSNLIIAVMDLYAKSNLMLFYVSNVFGRVNCNACNLDCNGCLYTCQKCGYTADVKCALLPKWIVHKSHQLHPLIRISGESRIRCKSCGNNEISGNKCKYCGGEVGETAKRCNSCGNKVGEFYFTCKRCGFYLDYECVLLPERVNHRWDKHPLLLSYPPFSDRPVEFYCEICEEEIHPKRWHYHCRECDQSFHPRCIPRLGVSRNFSFGRFLELGRHPHPLKLVREGEYKSSCDSCKAWMYGQRVFKCESCKFHICPECARIECEGKIDHPGKIAAPAEISE